jgi:hypothetical protein
MDTTELTVSIIKESPRIKSASTKPSQTHTNDVAAAIETIAQNLPFEKNVSYDTRVKLARNLVYKVFTNNKMLNAKSAINRNGLLRIAEKLIQDVKSPQRKQALGLVDPVTGLQKTYPSTNQSPTQKSHTSGPSSDLGNQPIPDKIPDPSEYQDRAGCIMSYENNGYSLAAATTACNDIFGPTTGSKGGTTTKKLDHGFGGGKSTITTWTPQAGEIPIKSGNIDVPSWAQVANLDREYKEYAAKSQVNTKSANVRTVSPEYFGVGSSIAEILKSKAEDREEAREARNKASIKSAASNTSKPKWAQSLGIFDEY